MSLLRWHHRSPPPPPPPQAEFGWHNGAYSNPKSGSFLKFTGAHHSFSFCTCAKCGSTTAMRTLYYMVTGRYWAKTWGSHTATSTPPVQRVEFWALKNVTVSITPGDLHIIVWRDPIQRYLSAFHSKVKCCIGKDMKWKSCYSDSLERARFNSSSWNNPSATIASVRQCGHGIVPPPPDEPWIPQCLNFSSYVRGLKRCHAKGKRFELNQHILPQDIRCPAPPDTPTIFLRNDEMGTLFESLRGFGLHRPPKELFASSHTTNKSGFDHVLTPPLLRTMQELAAPEYRFVNAYWRR